MVRIPDFESEDVGSTPAAPAFKCPRCGNEINPNPGGITYCNLPWKDISLNCWMMRPMTEPPICPMCGQQHFIGNPCITNTLRPGAPITKDRDPLLTEREKTHGSFERHAEITQRLKRVMEAELTYHDLIDRHKESLQMIQHKIGRILAGKANFKDHWDDIAGYAKLGSEACD